VIELLLSPAGLALLGLLIGSFLNVVVHRLPAIYMREWWAYDIADFALSDKRSWRAAFGLASEPPGELLAAAGAVNKHVEGLTPLSLWRPRSRCPACGHALGATENIPLLSWALQKGRCKSCKAPISARYPALELATALLFGACAWHFGPTARSVVACVAVALLLAMALIDLEFTLLPDSLTIPLVVLGLAAAAFGWSGTRWADAASGALLGYGVLWGLGAFWHIVFRKANAMAEGDMKMLAGLGALLGWKAVPGMLMMAAVLGAIIGIGLMVTRALKRETPIPFGPYLALGGMAGILFPVWINGFGDSLALLVP
jgi:leader peptidase (prepilin peptidase) / N-methyltransferase